MDSEKRDPHDNPTTFNNRGSVSNQGVYQTFNYYGHGPTQNDDTPTNSAGMDERRGNVKRPHTDTCIWILKLEEYRDWMDRSHGLFWVKGKPGSGKSTLMAFMHQEIKGSILPGNTVLDFFFSARGTELQRTPLGMLRSLLNQLCRQDADTLAKLRTIYKAKCAEFGRAKNGWEWRQPELEMILEDRIIASAKHRPLTIFVDALDETGAKSAAELVEYFNRVNDSVAMNGALGKICISCRHYPVLIGESGTEIFVENHNHDDISTFIHDSLRLRMLLIEETPDHRSWDNLKMELINSANGIFQWVRLVVPLIKMKFRDGESVANVQQFIRRVPHELRDIYEYILHNVIQHDYRTRALALFQWVCLAERPLSVTEMRYAMAANDARTTLARIACHKSCDFVPDDGVMKRQVKALSGGLIEVVSDGGRQNVQVIHQSVNDFLLSEGLCMLADIQDQQEGLPSWKMTTAIQDNDETIQSCQGSLYRACLHYLVTEDIRIIQREGKSRRLERWPFLEYATINLFLHAEKALAYRFEDTEQEICLLEEILPNWRTTYNDLRRWSSDTILPQMMLLHISCGSNLISIVRNLLSRNILPAAADGRGDTALHYAARRGHSEIGRMLVDKGADLNVTNNEGGTALTTAVGYGHILFAEFLLHEGAQVDHETGRHSNALQTAATKGSKEMVKMLLDAKADINAQGGEYGTALQAASAKGEKEIVQMLLDAKADINTQGGKYGTALQAASAKGEKEVVQILLDAKADVNTQGGEYNTALYAASAKGEKRIVQMLLDAKADVNTRGEHGTALYAASAEGEKEVVQMLLDAKADVNAQGGKYATALQAASAPTPRRWPASLVAQEEVVQMLLDAKADVNSQGGKYGTALQAASAQGKKKIVQMLLDAKADVNTQGGEYGTALYAATVRGKKEVIQMLLDAKADTNAQGGKYGTALYVATIRGQKEVVQMLLDAKADVNAQGIYGTALQAASAEGKQEVVQMLLDAKADVNTQGRMYGTALYAATIRGKKEVVQILLDAKADVNARGGLFSTALYAASAEGKQDMVQMLLDAKADVNAQGGVFGTALQVASAEGKQEVVQMLLDAKADVNSQGGEYGTALQVASAEGKQEVVQILLDAKADVNAQEGEYGTALYAASAKGKKKIVQMLLDAKADVNAQGGIYGTALHAASAEGKQEVVQMLLDAKADINAQGGEYGTALQAASAKGKQEVVQILLDAKADVNAQGGVFGTALQAASAEGRQEVVQMLLDAKAYVNAQGGGYGSPVHAAIRNGYPETAKLLLRYSATDRQRNKHTASDGDRNHNFNVSVTSSACPHITDLLGRTPLHLAVIYGHSDLISLLSETTAPPLLRDSYGRNPLDWASNDPAIIDELKRFWPTASITPKETQMRILQQSVRQLAKSLLQSTDKRVSFELFQLGRCLMFLENFAEASFIFSQQSYDNTADPIYCEVCRCAWRSGSRFVCKMCPEVELCSSCMAQYPHSDKLRTCRSHSFFEVLYSPRLIKSSSATTIPDDVQEWLKSLLVRFGEFPPHAGDVKTCAGFVRNDFVVAALFLLIPSAYFLFSYPFHRRGRG